MKFFIALIVVCLIQIATAELLKDTPQLDQHLIDLQQERICLNTYYEYMFSYIDIYDITKCKDKANCLTSIHIQFSKCETIHGNEMSIYKCIDEILQSIGDCKYCICDLLQNFYLCQGGNIMQHHG